MAARNVTLTRIRPGSAFKIGILLSLIGFAAWLLAVTVLYFVIDAAGVVDSMNSLIGGVGGETAIDFPLVLALAGLSGATGVVFVALMAPLTAFIYNALADLVGGLAIELTDQQ
ncbi:DUF3566 domain-containing protein [Corynebacterium genitalium ATCC 33030]|mgnify:FL=1|uniref:DUF3566 domain-containing protein n=1 Tax=Corynebacterium genitalium ATCC 33030 TaxID=585529 RepID=D7WBS9_9CORY|nr:MULTISPECIES: DUF3566 domain-containing protein [Corynebacterium]MCQ4619193.1 DUF3566 domain-containing protein [Corynebacterium pseudogenitalium]EFK55310.1 hypothetical protein HMPREF0291_10568 [Corynebacterium genitalium ATCC 33030]MCQ4620036.1 DUF3566 domain-containing protein [Corynebacterium sp. CCUG 71335]MCQ4622999.1 DUF3566 domain-containing protein [Corynebacterium sp. CCUG 70398]MCQ4624384.1 DUF3566 domain-containing protein [Corynebacterium sp. CCUG 69979]